MDPDADTARDSKAFEQYSDGKFMVRYFDVEDESERSW
jgi:hypothetical protein